MIKKYSSFLISAIIVISLNVIILVLLIIFLLPFFFITEDEKVKKYIKNQFLAVDQSVNAATGGDMDETISSRLGKNYRGTLFERFVDWLFWEGHCEGAEEMDEGKDSILK